MAENYSLKLDISVCTILVHTHVKNVSNSTLPSSPRSFQMKDLSTVLISFEMWIIYKIMSKQTIYNLLSCEAWCFCCVYFCFSCMNETIVIFLQTESNDDSTFLLVARLHSSLHNLPAPHFAFLCLSISAVK